MNSEKQTKSELRPVVADIPVGVFPEKLPKILDFAVSVLYYPIYVRGIFVRLSSFASTIMSELQWYYRKDGKPLGPVSDSELKRMAVSGELRPADTVCGIGMSVWLPAGDFEGLFPASNPIDGMKRSSPPIPPVLPQSTVSTASPPPVVPPPVPPVFQPTQLQPTQLRPAQAASSFGFVDQSNPYATFGLEPSSATSGVPAGSYNPMATLNQQDILAMEAVQAAEAAAQATRKKNSYAPSFSAALKRGPTDLRSIASCRWWMNAMFLTNVFTTILLAFLLFGYVIPGLEAGAQLTPRGSFTIVALYLVCFFAGFATIYFICRLSYFLEKSVIWNFMLCNIPFGAFFLLITLNAEATVRLKRY